MENRKQERVLVVGMARSGIAVAMLLAAQGALPILNDRLTREKLGDAMNELEGGPYTWRLGEDPMPLLDECDRIVISPGVPIQSPFLVEAKKRGIPVQGELELATCAASGVQVAITGTNGKTTTTTLMGEILRNAGKQTYVVGNIGAPVAAIALASKPEDYIVIEVSSFQLESTDTFHPHVAALLNITPDHLNRHGDMAEYIRLKERIFERQTAVDFAVYNADDPACVDIASRVKSRALGFSRTQEVPQGAFVRDGQIVVRFGETEKALCPIEEVRIPGPHNLENALAATAMAMALRIPTPVIRHTLRTFPGVEHRYEFVRMLGDVTYINDTKATNVDAAIKAIASIRVPTVLIAGGDDKAVSFAPFAEAIVKSGLITDVVLIGKTAGQIREALAAVSFASTHEAGFDFEKALNLARSMARPGGNVLLAPACASYDMFNNAEHRGATFKQLVHAWPA